MDMERSRFLKVMEQLQFIFLTKKYNLLKFEIYYSVPFDFHHPNNG